MRKDFPSGFGIASEVVFKNETIKGFVIDMLTIKSDGTTLAPISSLNKIDIDVILEREGKEPFMMFSGYLDDYLTGLYAQTTNYAAQITPRGLRHIIKVDWASVLKLSGNDILRIKFNAAVASFTALSNPNSAIAIESILASGNPSVLPVVKAWPYVTGEVNFDKKLGSNISKIVLATDYTAGYEASSKGKLSTISLVADGFEDNASENVVYRNNADMLSDNPSQAVKQLVLYNGVPISNAKLRTKLTAAADADTKVLVTQWAYL